MPRTIQQTKPSAEDQKRNAKLAKNLKKKEKLKKKLGGEDSILLKESKRLERKKKLLQRFRNMADQYQITKFSPAIRCIKKSVLAVHKGTSVEEFSTQIRVSAQAATNIINYVDSIVHQILMSSKKYVPRDRVTLKEEYIVRALENHEFREFLRPIDGHVLTAK